MITAFKDGRLTIRSAMYLSSFLSHGITGFSMPIVMKYMLINISEFLIASTTIIITILGILLSYMKQSKLLIKFTSYYFIPLVVCMDFIYFILATIGEARPDIRFVGYHIITILGLGLLKVVKKDNICNCLSGTTIVTFEAKCDTLGSIGKALGGASVIIVLELIEISITAAMYLEMIICMFSHWLQIYINSRIKKDILKKENEHISFIDTINDIFRKKRKNKKDNIINDDKIFDQ